MKWSTATAEHEFETGLRQALEQLLPHEAGHRVRLIFLDRPTLAGCELFMERWPANNLGLPIVLQSQALWVGPWLKDSQAKGFVCLCCALRRFNSTAPERKPAPDRQTLNQYVPLVAAGTASLVEAASFGEFRLGTVWMVNLRSGGLHRCTVTPEHQCRFCSLPRHARELSTGLLRAALFPDRIDDAIHQLA
jgi:hypothetical protein